MLGSRDCVDFDDLGDSASSCGNSSRHGGTMTIPMCPDEFGYRATPSACEAAADDVDWPQQGGNRFRQLRLLFFDLCTLRSKFELFPCVFNFLLRGPDELWADVVKDLLPWAGWPFRGAIQMGLVGESATRLGVSWQMCARLSLIHI